MSALVSGRSHASLPSLRHAVWHADQTGTHQAAVTSTEHRALDDEWPNRG